MNDNIEKMQNFHKIKYEMYFLFKYPLYLKNQNLTLMLLIKDTIFHKGQ